ncbi:DUF2510 domain-containing protein [Mycobacterium sp. NPDC050041]|uniref:DUF2510 domain-containing protein n=1 Tax=Mycobacterium sp. NPDC050041 TaxID=3364293 RepID=UPI003C2DC907
MGEPSSAVPAGWYPDPAGSGQQRYFDGAGWTDRYAPFPPPTIAPSAANSGYVVPAASPARTVVTGPNHVFHGVLTLLTFWACGGWGWVWLLVAFDNRRRVDVVDEYGHVGRPPAQYDGLGAIWVDDEGQWRWGSVAVTLIAIVAAVALLAVIT